jgi:hypothetical protein
MRHHRDQRVRLDHRARRLADRGEGAVDDPPVLHVVGEQAERSFAASRQDISLRPAKRG